MKTLETVIIQFMLLLHENKRQKTDEKNESKLCERIVLMSLQT